jgi:hypothetical protein
MACITKEDVREEMMDRTAADNLVLPDLAFTDDDIVWAMKKAARKFNMVRPYVVRVESTCLPATLDFFYDGIAWALYRRWLGNVLVNDEDYSAGGVQASVQGKLAANLDKLVKEVGKEFVDAATEYKLHINLNDAFGRVG